MDTAEAEATEPVIAKAAIAIPLSRITPSPTNPRKTIDEAKLQELAVSIRTYGLLSPITVRPHAHADPDAPFYELVLGERRWRACEIADLAEIPAFVEPMSDAEAAERQLVENAQRVDVPPLEEGAAYRRLIDEHKHTIETLMGTLGKSRSHIYSRIALTRLAPYVQRAIREGELSTTIGELATRIGDHSLQERFVRECIGQLDDDAHSAIESVGIVAELVSDDGRPFPARDACQPLSTRAAAELLRRRYSTRLALAKFPTSDPSLVPAAGSCVTCEHRSGNQPTLPGVVGRDDDLCLRPSCYAGKTQAAWTRAADEAQARGVKVVPAAAATRVFTHDGVTVQPTSPYVDPDQDLPPGLARAGSKATWGKLLGKRAAAIPHVLVQDEAGAPRELIDREAAIAELTKLGKIDAPDPPAKKSPSSSSPEASSKRADRDQEESEIALRRALINRLKSEVIEATERGIPEKKALAWLRWMIASICDGMHLGAEHPLLSGIDPKRPWEAQLVDKAKTLDKARAILTGLVFSEVVERVDLDDLDDEPSLSILKLLGIDPAKVALELVDAKSCGVTDGKGKSSGCVLAKGHDGAHSNGHRTWPAKKGGRS